MPENRSRKRAPVWLVAVAVAGSLALSACQNVADPAAQQLKDALEAGIDIASFKPDDALRTRFLPPIGKGNPKGEFVSSLSLEIAVFALAPGDGAAEGPLLLPPLVTGQSGFSVSGGVFSLAWPAIDPSVAERVRLEIRLEGTRPEPVCNEYKGDCVGFIDVRIVERGGKGHGGGSSDGLITLPSGSTLNASFKVLVPTDLSEVLTLSRRGGLLAGQAEGEALNCPANEAALPSQGLQAVGAGLQAVGAGLQAVGAGGLFIDPATTFYGRVKSVAQIAAALPAPSAHKGEDVLLIVLDDFGGVFRLPSELRSGSLGAIDDAALGGLSLSHGALVLHEIVELLDARFGSKGSWSVSGGQARVDYGSYHGPRLRVLAVDARSGGVIDTDAAGAALKSALLGASAAGFDRVVVNMSFAVVPCGVLADFESTFGDLSDEDDDEAITFADYLVALLALNGVSGSTAEALRELAHLPVELLDDPFFAQLSCPGEAGACGAGLSSLTFVAASGNYGQAFPLFPAAFPGVVSVGAQPVVNGKYVAEASSFSNAAMLLAPGDLIDVRTKSGYTLAFAGTSYAAPVVSAFAALDQRAATPKCAAATPSDPSVSQAELATAELSNLPLLSAFARGGPDAVTQLCGG